MTAVLSLFRGVLIAPREPKKIIAEVASRYGLTLDDLTGQSRLRHIAHARQEAMWELRRRTSLSLPHIGKFMGGRDHSTILYGVRAHKARKMAEVAA